MKKVLKIKSNKSKSEDNMKLFFIHHFSQKLTFEFFAENGMGRDPKELRSKDSELLH